MSLFSLASFSDLLNPSRRDASEGMNAQIVQFHIDSRLVGPGDLFFALRGKKTDGHLFLKEVKMQGALGAVVSEDYVGPDHGLVLFKVKDVKEALQEAARTTLLLYPARVVGVTGSVGKTTVKDFIYTLLSDKYRVCKSLASHNTKLTLPLTLLNRTGEEEIVILEMGMSQMGDIQRLVEIAPPEIALITKIALAHSAFFPEGLPSIAKGKGEIFTSSKLQYALFCHDFYSFLSDEELVKAKRLSFSLEDQRADYVLLKEGDRYVLNEKGVSISGLRFPFFQTHILHNCLAAIAVARIFDLSWEEIQSGLDSLKLPEMRFQMIEKGGIVFINDAYNANPESMKGALSNLPLPQNKGRTIAVLGTMKELGSFSETAHAMVGRFAADYVDHLFVLGEEALPLYRSFFEVKQEAYWFCEQKSLAEKLIKTVRPGDVVLIKGSRSMQMEKLLVDFIV